MNDSKGGAGSAGQSDAERAPSLAALDHILKTVGWDAIPGDHVRFTGADPVLPTNFKIGTAGSASIAAIGLAAADLWQLRTGRRQNVSVDVRAATMALRSQRYLRVVDQPQTETWSKLSGFYRSSDGRWIQLHMQFPHHHEGALKLLGCEADRDTVATRVAEWKAAELEQALVDAGLVGTMSRTNEEWAAHPQSAAADRLPLFDIEKIGESDPETMPDGDRPLSGIRVLDLTRVLAGPTSGRTLAEHGAVVMRISGPHLPFHENLVMDTGHGKIAAHVDLRNAEGTAQLQTLVRNSDVFTQGYRPGTIAARGFSPEDLAAMRPGIISVNLCAYGHEGPWRDRRGFDTLVQGVSGITVEEGQGGAPAHLPGSVLDYVTGYLAAFGAMTALARRAREGGSYRVRVSLLQTAHWLKSLGRIPDSANARQLPDPSYADVADLLTESQGPFGHLSFLKPVVQLSETPPHWVRPVSPLGSHPPVWPT
jgi:crotonobetainyl-CoA:carnitine CoA-transferase CaiB-like acyl-CoA transferase